jgi:thiamine-phosphate diphosphorylase
LRRREPQLTGAVDLDGEALRDRLRDARLYLLFTPSLCGEREPLAVLEAALPHVDVVQVRPKAPDRDLDPSRPSQGLTAVTSAREVHDWTGRVLDLLAAYPALSIPVIVNDRVDVARALRERGCAGVHLGQDDAPPRVARDLLGPEPLIGLSTHSNAQVVAALDEPVDYLGFGPIHATSTKGYARGLGPEGAWIADQASALPIFPIGGIDASNAGELEDVGRAAISSAILSAPDPERAARELRALLEGAA